MRVEKYSSSGKIAPIRRVKQKITSFNYIMKVSISALLILSIALLPKAFTSADPVWQDRYQANWSGGVSDETVIDNDTATTYKEIDRLETTEGISIAEGETAGSLISNIFDMGDKSYFGKAKVTTNDVEGEGAKGEYVLQVRSIPNDKDGYPDIDKAIGWSDACNIATTDEDTNMNIYNSKCVRRPEKYLQYRIIITSDNSDFVVSKINFEYDHDYKEPNTGLNLLTQLSSKVSNQLERTYTWTQADDLDFGWKDNKSGLAGIKYCITDGLDHDGFPFDDCDPEYHSDRYVGPNGLNDDSTFKYQPGTAEYIADVWPAEGNRLTTSPLYPKYKKYHYNKKEVLDKGLFIVYIQAIDNVGNFTYNQNFYIDKFTIMPSGPPQNIAATNITPGTNMFSFKWNVPEEKQHPVLKYQRTQTKADVELFTEGKNREQIRDLISEELGIEVNEALTVEEMLELIIDLIAEGNLVWAKLFSGSADEISYCYAVNSSPDPDDTDYDEEWVANNCDPKKSATLTKAGATKLPADSYGTKQGKNTLYMTSINEAGNIAPIYMMPVTEEAPLLDAEGKKQYYEEGDDDYEESDDIEDNLKTVDMPVLDESGDQVMHPIKNYSKTEFEVKTLNPDTPQNVEANDISNRIANTWRTVISWTAPENNLAKIKRYQIFRSTDESAAKDDNWGESIGDTTSLSYTDDSILLDNKDTYYYGVRSCDDANSCSDKVDAINIRSGGPGIKLSGRYTEPAKLTDGPNANNIGTSKATIGWQTDRESDSKVYISTKANVDTGKDSDYSAGSDKQVTDHIMDLTNLQPSTKYYYKVTWTDYDNNTGVSSEKSFTTAPAPSFSGVIIDKISVDSASIAFTVSSAKSVSVYYGKTEAFGGIKSVNTSSAKSAYQLNLSDLDDGSKYYVKLNGFDSDGKEYQGSTHYFNTTPRPRISNLRFQPVKDAASNTTIVSWSTNVPTNSMLSYGVSGDTQREVIKSKLSTEHEITISELIDDSTYSLVARSRDEIGNLAVSETKTFKTALDTRPPKISKINVETAIRGSGSEAKGQIIISWTTDELATSQIAFGQGSPGSYSNKTVEDGTLSLEHTVVVSDLSTSSIYQVQPLSKDKAGNSGKGTNQSAIVGRGVEDVFTIIFNSLRNIFGIK